MSFILDALKKSEIERQRQSVPGLIDVPPAPRRRGIPAWGWVLAGLLGINVAVLLVVLIRRPAAPAAAHPRVAAASTPAAAEGTDHFSPLDNAPVYAPEIPVPGNTESQAAGQEGLASAPRANAPRAIAPRAIAPRAIAPRAIAPRAVEPSAKPALAAGETHLFAGQTRFSLVSAMTSMLALGLSLEQVLPMVTTNAARMIGMEDELGQLRVGGIADISVLSDSRGRWTLNDNEGTKVHTDRLLEPLFCLRAGHLFQATAPILPSLSAA